MIVSEQPVCVDQTCPSSGDQSFPANAAGAAVAHLTGLAITPEATAKRASLVRLADDLQEYLMVKANCGTKHKNLLTCSGELVDHTTLIML